MLVEPPRASPAARWAAAPLLSDTARRAALIAAGVLIVTGRGDLWTVALLLGVADASMLTAFVVAAVATTALARVGSAALVDISGAQAVLGGAGFTGSLAAVSATWTSAVSLLAVARDRVTGAVLGMLAGALVAGPALSGGVRSVAVWVLGIAAGTAIGWFVRPADERRTWHVVVDVALASVAIALGVLAGYH